VQMLKKAAAIYPEDVDTLFVLGQNLRVLATAQEPLPNGERSSHLTRTTLRPSTIFPAVVQSDPKRRKISGAL